MRELECTPKTVFSQFNLAKTLLKGFPIIDDGDSVILKETPKKLIEFTFDFNEHGVNITKRGSSSSNVLESIRIEEVLNDVLFVGISCTY